ncbi:hypothetical protein [Streptomyces sp. SLBN-31]|uniref:hypothetical protein n=1 Tax=Streptomyces sp. SLBN-31 TaxID=2768444 RepID=UPI0011523E05|nr:hypothetical protein [Streptomyces sp. SLBN-31]
MVIDLIEALEARPPGLDRRAVDVVWVFNDPSHCRSLIGACGWSEEEYTAWIADQMYYGLGLDDS